MRRVSAGLALILAASAPCLGQEHPPTARHLPKETDRQSGARLPKAATGLQVTNWFDLTTSQNAWPPGGRGGQIDTLPRPLTVEEITVFGRRHDREAEWRADIAAGQPIYEAGDSESARPSYGGYLQWTSPEQERLMSIKTDALGLCGALGGYIQCPNKP
jgi:hypothetical protein